MSCKRFLLDGGFVRAGAWSAPLLTITLLVAGCGAFNPAFLNVVDPSGSANLASIDNAPGHVVVAFINNATVDELLISFLESAEGGNLILTDAEKRSLRPRVRLRVLVTFSNGASMPIEFIDGSKILIDQRFDALSFPDLNQNDLDNVVVTCDVASVQLLPGSQIEVFIPVQLNQFRRVDIINVLGLNTFRLELDQQIPPQFRPLLTDQLDADGNVTFRQNIGVRDAPVPVTDPFCGSVITIALEGTLSIPFSLNGEPGFDEEDLGQVGLIGGRYEFIVSVR